MEVTWSSPPQEIVEAYRQSCRDFVADDERFANFKRDPAYQKVLEGNEVVVGEIALKSISEIGGYPLLLEKLARFKENESVGNPALHTYPIVGEVAPSTLRYVNSYLEIARLLNVFVPKTVVEVGGGYGGLYKTLSVIYDFDSYTLIDLPEAQELSAKYLNEFNLPLTDAVPDTFDLFIADSSMAECSVGKQKEYIELAKRAKYIYIVYNTLHTDDGKEGYRLLMEALPDGSAHEARDHNGNPSGVRVLSFVQ